ncbi:MAG: hemagglutinin repeat-containing protein, partial [Achromobacter piechaudii]
MSLGSCRILDQFLGLQSGGGNTSLIGATGQAKQIIASVGNNLRIETLQDTSHYES